MSSSVQTIRDLRQAEQALAAKAMLEKNLNKTEPSDALAITDAFRTLQYELDAIPMTRNQRDEIDLKIKTLALLLDPQ